MSNRHWARVTSIVCAMLAPIASAQTNDASSIATQFESIADEVIKLAQDAARNAADEQVLQTKLGKLDEVKKQLAETKSQLDSGQDSTGTPLSTDQREKLNATLRAKQAEYDLLLEASSQLVFAQAQHKLSCTFLPQKSQQLLGTLATFRQLIDSKSAAQRKTLLDTTPPLKALHDKFPKILAAVHDATDNARAKSVDCSVGIFEVDPWQQVNEKLGAGVIIDSLKISQWGTTNTARTLADAVRDFQEVDTKSIQMVGDYNNAVRLFNNASVSTIDFTLNSSYEQQLIKAPAQPWELTTGDALTASGVGVGILGNVLGLVIQPPSSATDQQSPGFFRDGKNYALIGTGLGIAAAAIGQALKTHDVPDVIREPADRLAVNRLVGLSVQRMAYALALAKAHFGESETVPEIAQTTPYKESQDEESFRNTLSSYVDRLISKDNASPPLSSVEISQLREIHVKWNNKVKDHATNLSDASNSVTSHMNAARKKSELLAAVINTSSSALQELRDLLGARASNTCTTGASPILYDCDMKSESNPLTTCPAGHSCADPSEYCKAYTATPGTKHFATDLLSDKGFNDLMRLASCNYKSAQSAQKSVQEGINSLDKAQRETGELNNLLIRNVAGRVVEVDNSMKRLANGD